MFVPAEHFQLLTRNETKVQADQPKFSGFEELRAGDGRLVWGQDGW